MRRDSFICLETGEICIKEGFNIYYGKCDLKQEDFMDGTLLQKYKDLKLNPTRDIVINKDQNLIIGREKPMTYKDTLAVPKSVLELAYTDNQVVVICTDKGNFATNKKYSYYNTLERKGIMYCLYEPLTMTKVKVKGAKHGD